MSFTVEPDDDEATVLGKTVSDLQEDLEVGLSKITGTLKYVTGYTGYSGDPDLQEGNYMALKVDNVPDGSTTTAELLNGYSGPVELDSDMDVVFRIEDKDAQRVKITVSLNGESFSKTYDLDDLICEEGTESD